MDMHDDDSLQAARSLRWTLLFFLFFLMFFALPSPSARAAGTTRFVKQYAAGAANCSDWDNACTLQTALTVAIYGDAIWVAQGTYKPTSGTDPNATFNLKSGIYLYGGFVGNETSFSSRNWTTHVTTLSGDLGTAHSLHVVTANATESSTRLDGFTITGGQGGSAGGGVYIINGSLRILNSIITNNSANSGGGLFQSGDSGRVIITDSIIQLNAASAHGGGMYVIGDLALTDTQVLSNTASGYGGGLTNWAGRTDLNGGLFSNNRALTSNGGAVNVNNGIGITNTQFISNTSNDLGGALTQWNNGYPVTITGARFERNLGKTKGGGAYVKSPVTITNTSFVTNTVDPGVPGDRYGGGVYAVDTIQVVGSTFSGNAAKWCYQCGESWGGGVYASVTATIQDSTFDANDAWVGGGVSGAGSVSATRSTFKNNTGGSGGGVYAESAVQVSDSDFLNNNVWNNGAAIAAGGDATISGTRLVGSSGRVGGAVSVNGALSISNALFAENKAINGAAFSAGGPATVRHVTVAQASSSTEPAIYMWKNTLAITDTIFSNYEFAIHQDGGTLSADYDLFSTSTPITPTSITLPVAHNLIGVNPQFANPAAGDYHLTASSPAVDAGINVGIAVDLDGRRRPLVLGYDMGAFEFGSLVHLPMLQR